MNKRKIISQLQQLQSVKLSQRDFKKIKNDIDLHIFLQKREMYFIANPLVAFLLPMLIISVVSITFLVMHAYKNQYNDAQTALLRAEHAMKDIQNNHAINGKTIAYLTDSVDQANKQITALKLKGEKGKYTMQECLQLYRKYYLDLETIESNLQKIPLSTVNEKSLSQLKTKVLRYDAQSKNKLQFYKKSL